MDWWLEIACRAAFLVATMYCFSVLRQNHLRAVAIEHMAKQSADSDRERTPAVEEGVALPGP